MLSSGYGSIASVNAQANKGGMKVEKNPRRNVKKVNVGPEVNSEFSELAPIISADGKRLFFTMGAGNPENFGSNHLQDCYFSNRSSNGRWSQPARFDKPINSNGNDAIAGVLADGVTLFVKNFDHNPVNGLCFARADRSGWKLSKILIDKYVNTNPLASQCISQDGEFIIFSAETPEGYGGLDLYVSRLIDRAANHYSAPENLGPVLNTPKDDFSPFLAPDGQTLYFASKGKGGYGDADMFLARRLDNSWINWTAPQNLGPQLNTPGMDAYYSVPASGDVAYCSSSNGSRHMDIYIISLTDDMRPKPVVLVNGIVKSPSGVPLEARITCKKLSNDSIIATGYSNFFTGRFTLILPVGIQYSIHAENSRYLPYSDNLDLRGAELYREVSASIVLDSIVKGGSITLRNIFFDLDKATLRPESNFELDKLAQLMDSNKTWQVVIEGHTDSLGSAEHNQVLSKQRAESVIAYLTSKGINAARLSATGYGASKPVATNANEEGRQQNRRVVFRILQLAMHLGKDNK